MLVKLNVIKINMYLFYDLNSFFLNNNLFSQLMPKEGSFKIHNTNDTDQMTREIERDILFYFILKRHFTVDLFIHTFFC